MAGTGLRGWSQRERKPTVSFKWALAARSIGARNIFLCSLTVLTTILGRPAPRRAQPTRLSTRCEVAALQRERQVLAFFCELGARPRCLAPWCASEGEHKANTLSGLCLPLPCQTRGRCGENAYMHVCMTAYMTQSTLLP